MIRHPEAHPRLLIADDDPDLSTLLGEFLSEEGYDVALATSMDEALRLANEAVFDLVITDVFIHQNEQAIPSLLPLLETIRPTPVGVITGWPLIEEATLDEGFAFLLTKPFDMGELLTMIADQVRFIPSAEQTHWMNIVERYCAAFNVRNLDTCLAFCAEDLVFYPPTQTPFAEQGQIVGRDAYRDHIIAGWWRVPDFHFDELCFYPRPSGVALRFKESWADAKEADGRASMTATMFFDFAEDQISAISARMNARRLNQLLSH